MRATCPKCRHVHAANDAIAVGRFSPNATYRAATAPTPERQTRAEAEADECRWRQSRPAPVIVEVEPTPKPEPVSDDQPELEPFPALLMESAARAKAWRDFLANVAFSLKVWQIDPEVRSGEHVIDWVRGCRDDLSALLLTEEGT